METVIVEAVRVLHLVSPTDDPASELLVPATVFDDVPRVVHLFEGVLAPLMIYEHRILFVWVECGVGIFRWRPVICRAYEGEPNRLTTRKEEQPDEGVVQMDSRISVAFDRQVHTVALVDVMEEVSIQRVGLGA